MKGAAHLLVRRLGVAAGGGALALSLLAPTGASATALGVPATTVSQAAGAQAAPVKVTIQEVDLDGPSIEKSTVTVRNNTSRPMRQIKVAFRGPVGWSTAPPTKRHKGAIQPGQSARLTFQVAVPSLRPGFRTYDFTATTTYAGGDGAGSVTTTRTQHTGEPLDDLSEAYNNVGVTDESATGEGDFDGSGNSFSAQKLAAAGITPGGEVSALGATFTWPTATAGTPNNVATSGQVVDVEGKGSSLAFLGSGSSQSATGAATVHYTDGTSTRESVGFPNWSFQEATAHGATLVAATKGRNRPDGYGDGAYDYRVFANSIDIDASKTVDFVQLPSNAAIHVFDMEVVE